MTPPGCPEKETQISEIVGAPTLVTNGPRTGESRSSRDFTNGLVTLGSLFSLIFLASPAITGLNSFGFSPIFPAS